VIILKIIINLQLSYDIIKWCYKTKKKGEYQCGGMT
jgi:hypothetical protein